MCRSLEEDDAKRLRNAIKNGGWQLNRPSAECDLDWIPAMKNKRLPTSIPQNTNVTFLIHILEHYKLKWHIAQ